MKLWITLIIIAIIITAVADNYFMNNFKNNLEKKYNTIEEDLNNRILFEKREINQNFMKLWISSLNESERENYKKIINENSDNLECLSIARMDSVGFLGNGNLDGISIMFDDNGIKKIVVVDLFLQNVKCVIDNKDVNCEEICNNEKLNLTKNDNK